MHSTCTNVFNVPARAHTHITKQEKQDTTEFQGGKNTRHSHPCPFQSCVK